MELQQTTQKRRSGGWLMSLVYVDMNRRKRMLRREAWLFIVLADSLLLCAWVLPGSFDTSSSLSVCWTWAMMLVRVLYYQIGLGLLLIGIIAAWRRKYRMAIYSLPLTLLTVFWPWMNLKGSPATAHGPVIRVISANLLMVNRDTPPILREIEDANADLVFLQEYTDHWDKEFTQWFGQAYPYRLIYPQEDSFGAAIYSRYPFAGQPKLDSSMGKWGIVQLSADVAVGNTIIQCRNIHLVPPRNWDYTVEHLDEMREFEQRLRGDSSRNVIIAGDFNFTGSTLQAKAIGRSGFHDAFDEAGNGRGATWPVNGVFRYLPGIRLDHIFLSPKLHCRRIRTGNGYGSDHRPLIAEVELLPTK